MTAAQMAAAHVPVALVTIATLILYIVMGFRVGQARGRFGVEAPAISGHADFERVFRVQANTLEWLPIFLAGLWLTAIYWNEWVAAALGVVWIVGRFLYMTGYARAAGARSLGFIIQGLAAMALLGSALVSVVMVGLHAGG
jgi:glutathione S-transferase